MASAHINFQLRPNKSIERKLIFGALAYLAKEFEVGKYAYIGFGAYWFTDFVFAHKRLGMTDLVSIEGEPEVAARARANVPFACIDVLEGESENVLPGVLATRKRAIAWLDYDGATDAAVTKDMAVLCEQLQGGSVIALTVNASSGQWGSETDREQHLRELFPEVPTPLPSGFFQKSASGFPRNLALLLLHRLRRSVEKRINHRFVPLFNIFYQDGAPMITVGGVIIEFSQEDLVKRTGIMSAAGVTGEAQLVIAAPVITRREKLALDRLIPRASGAKCTGDEIRAAGLSRVTEEEEIDVYNALLRDYLPVYRDYPVYSEFEL